MDTNVVLTPEEVEFEKQALQDVKEEDVRAGIIQEYGFDETIDVERIDKLTKKEIDNRKKLSSAIGQKIKHRTLAQELSKKAPPESPKPNVEVKDGDLSQRDLLAIVRENVNDEDLTYVQRYAKLENIQVADALKKEDLKTYLKLKKEERDSAEAANINATRRANSKPSDEDLLNRASTGALPETDDDIGKLAAARMNLRKSRKI